MNLKGVPLIGAQTKVGWFSTSFVALSRKWGEIELRSQLITSRKSYMGGQFVQNLHDLQRPWTVKTHMQHRLPLFWTQHNTGPDNLWGALSTKYFVGYHYTYRKQYNKPRVRGVRRTFPSPLGWGLGRGPCNLPRPQNFLAFLI